MRRPMGRVAAVLAVALALVLALALWNGRATARPVTAPTILTAVIKVDGTLARGIGAVSSDSVCIPAEAFALSSTDQCPGGTVRYADGSYVVTFNRDITSCAYVATAGEAQGFTSGPDDAITFGTTPFLQKGPNSVFVLEYDAILARDWNSSGFHLVVVCP